MVKAYFKYVFRSNIGSVAGSTANIVSTDINQLITAQNQYVLITNIKTGKVETTLFQEDKNSTITFLKISNTTFANLLAVGYEDGDVIIWDLNTNQKKTNLNGHKAAITSIDFDYKDSKLITGSQDTTIIVWDLIGETALYQLNGHKNAITQLAYYEIYGETKSQEVILSASKDGLFKIWDIKIASAIETISSKNNEIWSFAICKQTDTVLLGTNSDSILALKLESYKDTQTNLPKLCRELGVIKKNSFARPLEMSIQNNILFIMTSEKSIEVFKILTDEQLEKKQKRKLKRIREKGQDIIPEELESQPQFLDKFVYNTTFHLQKKLKSFTYVKKSKNTVAISYTNNNVDIITYKENDETSYYAYEQKATFEKMGHRTAVRAIDISDNDQWFISGSGEGVKIWDTETLQPIKTFENGKYITQVMFLPKNRYFLAGDKEGTLELYDLNTSELIQTIKAHDSSIWSLSQHPNPVGYDGFVVATGSADRKVKFWDLTINSQKQLQLVENKCLHMTDDVHQVQFTPKGEHYAVSLLDFSVKIFFSDSDKLFLSLYGHKLPVLSLDISSDSFLIITGSADKNVKIWGLDFGNCHKSIFAHQESIMQVKFVKNTHYFFTSSRDKTIKYWDGDTYQLVMVFEQSQAEVWALAVSSIGDFFISGSNDKCMRIWKQTSEQTFVQLEEEERMEKMMIEDYADDQLKNEGQSTITLGQEQEATAVIKKKFENLKYGEEIMAAIDLAEELREEQMQYELELIEYEKQKKILKTIQPPEKPDTTKIFNQSIPEFVMNQIALTKTTELENSLKFLHLTYIEKLLYYINFYVENNINVELASRILFFILNNHQDHISNSKKLVSLLVSIQSNLRPQLQKQKDNIGFNIVGLQTLQREMKQQNPEDILSDDIFQTRTALI